MIKSRQKNPIGLDISDLSLKLVRLGEQKNNIKIEALDKIELPTGIIDGGIINDKEAVISAVTKLLTKNKLLSGGKLEVAACLPETKTFIKLIEIEKTPNNISDMINVEMEKHVPISIEELYYDWQTIDTTNDGQLVLVGAPPKNVLNQYIDLLKGANLSISALEIESAIRCRLRMTALA